MSQKCDKNLTLRKEIISQAINISCDKLSKLEADKMLHDELLNAINDEIRKKKKELQLLFFAKFYIEEFEKEAERTEG